MTIAKTVEALNAMQAEGVIESYAIVGAVATYNYIEPRLTEDLDVFVSFDQKQHDEISALEGIAIEGWKLRFVRISNSLDREALAEAEQVELRNESGNPVFARVLKPEFIVAICLRLGRPTDLIHIAQFLEERAVDSAALCDVLARHGLRSAWQDSCARMRIDHHRATDVREAGRTASGHPDISDILAEKAEMRRRLAKRSFQEKVVAMEALHKRLKPFKEAREKRKAERECYPSPAEDC
jgi:hypothetical protein